MPFFNTPRTGRQFVDRLIDQRDVVQDELDFLRQEIDAINQLIAHKHLSLRHLNRQIIQRTNSSHYLQLVFDKRIWHSPPKKANNVSGLKPQLHCLAGGKKTS